MSKSKLFLTGSLFLSLFAFSCSPTSPSLNELESVFKKLQDNNFTVNIEGSYANYDEDDIKRHKMIYTPYSIEAEGDFGYAGLAQDDKNNQVFRYNIVEDEVVSSIPLINYSTGLRYENIYDYEYGMQDFDLSYLPKEKNDDGYYYYEFGKSIHEDKIMLQVFLRMGYSGIHPDYLKMKVVSNVLMIEAQLDYYEHIDRADIVKTVVNDIGTSENKEIKKYLEDGKTSKTPLDLNFYKFFTNYLNATNYTVDMYKGEALEENRFLTEKCIDEAVFDDFVSANDFGYMLSQGIVTQFEIDDNKKVNIQYTPQIDTNGNPFTEIYGQVIAYSFFDISFDYMIGYVDEENENIYHLTDSQFVFVLGYLCGLDISESYYADEVIIEILDEENYEFKATFNIYDKNTKLDLFTRTCIFYDLNNTRIEEVENYLAFGDDASKQDISDLETVLNMFKNNNYSIDSRTSAGMAKIYITENYFYEELYGNPMQNIGFMKVDGKVRQFYTYDNQVYLEAMDYTNSVNFPGVGTYFGAGNDCGMLSNIDDRIYDLTNYEVTTLNDISYWKMNNEEVALKLYNYLFYGIMGILPYNAGFMVVNDNENSKISMIAAFIASDGSYKGYDKITYYDIGTTSYPLIDEYIASL